MHNASSREAPNFSRYAAMASRASPTRLSCVSGSESLPCDAEHARLLLLFWTETEREEKEMDMEVLLGFKGGFGKMERFDFETGGLDGEGNEQEDEKWRWWSGGAAIGAAAFEFVKVDFSRSSFSAAVEKLFFKYSTTNIFSKYICNK